MTASGRRRGVGVVCVGLLCAVSGSIAGMPLQPAPTGLPALPPLPGGPVPSPFDAVTKPVALPQLPPLPVVPVGPATAPELPPLPTAPVTPPIGPVITDPRVPPPVTQLEFPQLSAPPQPVVPQPPAPPEPAITEPVVTVHRFKGKYLGGDSTRALVYVQNDPLWAEIQNRPLVDPIPAADAGTNDDVKHIHRLGGEVVQHDGRVFLSTPRELFVIDAQCCIDWQFALPGKPGNGERLLGAVGFDDGKVFVASQHDPKPGDAEKPTGHIYTLDAATGRQTGFASLPGGFGEQSRFFSIKGIIYATNGKTLLRYDVADRQVTWSTSTALIGEHHAAGHDGFFTTTARGFGVVTGSSFELFLPGCTATAPATPFFIDQTGKPALLVPVRADAKGECSLALFDRTSVGGTQLWRIPVKREITAAPVVRGGSVYFVAGNVVYRVSAATGAICWKQTLPLKPEEVLTNLALVEGELRASGPGVLVRVVEKAEPLPNAPSPNARPVPVPSGGETR